MNENPVQDLKEKGEMEDSLTTNDHESKQPEISEMMLQNEGQRGSSSICEELEMTKKKKEILTDDELKMTMNSDRAKILKRNWKFWKRTEGKGATPEAIGRGGNEKFMSGSIVAGQQGGAVGPSCPSLDPQKKDILTDDEIKVILTKMKKIFTDDESKTEQSSNEEYETLTAEMYKNQKLYLATMSGDHVDFERTLKQISPEDAIWSELNVIGNTYLHVAVKHKHVDIMKSIAGTKPSLVLAKNLYGETVLHLAAKGNEEPMVKALLEIVSDETQKRDLLMADDEIGNTALHQALLNGFESMASLLIEQDFVPLYHMNKRLESAVYLAVKAGFVVCVSSILEKCLDESRLTQIFENKSPLPEQYFKKENKSPIQEAMKRKNIDVLKAIINSNPILIHIIDSKGRNPLHFAASLGHMEAARYLLTKDDLNATRRDKRGELPIHLAARKGHVDIIRYLLVNFTEADELLSMSGRNILHIAAWKGRHNVVRFFLKHPKLGPLLNMKDIFGNTALHLACMKNHPMIVSALTWDKRFDTKAANNKGMTALDVAYQCDLRNPTLAKRLIWAALKSASVPGNLGTGRMVSADEKVYKKRATTLLLVATLVATVTFAAGFTMPGGYINSEPSNDLGMAAMWKDMVFHLFVFCDTIAIYSSIFAVTALMWAQIGDIDLVINALEIAAPLLGVALIMMSVAFFAGVTIVVTKLRWLQIALLAMGVSFSAALLVFLLPLFLLLPVCLLLSSRIQILRYISYYPFRFLAYVSRKRPHMHH